MKDELDKMVQNDVQKFQNLSSSGMDTSLPSMIEMGFGALTALSAIIWLLALLWVPDPIDGMTWMGMGMLALAMFGLPAGTIYLLRRGGADVIRAIVQDMAG